MKMKKLIVLSLTFLTVASPVLAMEKGSNNNNDQKEKPFELMDFSDEVLLEIINQLIAQASTITEALECRKNLASANQHWAAVAKDSSLLYALVKKLKNAQEQLFVLTQIKEKVSSEEQEIIDNIINDICAEDN